MKFIIYIVFAIQTLTEVTNAGILREQDVDNDIRKLLKESDFVDKLNPAKFQDGKCAMIVCPEEWTPVCGNNGETYASACDLKWKNCARRQNIVISHNGECVTKRSYEEHLQKTLKDNKCAMIVCPEEWAPVCGNNGETYASPCDLKWKNCDRSQNVEISHHGVCVTKRSYQDYLKMSVKDSKCDNIICPEEWKPLCGSNDETYASACDLKWKNCYRGQNVELKYNGECVTNNCDNIVCPEEWKPVCGNNGETYASPCDLKWKNCDRGQNVEIVFNGQCVSKRAFNDYMKRSFNGGNMLSSNSVEANNWNKKEMANLNQNNLP